MDTKNLKVGDIIWGKRYKDKEERERIPVGHREGPYIIIEKRKNRIYGLECTTKSWTGWKMLKLKIKELGKNNYVFLGKIFNINKSNYLYKIGKINNTELNLIKKQLYIIQKTNYRNKIKKVIIDKEEIKLSKGDIITYNKEKLYIRCVRNNKLSVTHLSLKTKKNIIKINGIDYSVHLNKRKWIDIDENIELENVCDFEFKEIFSEAFKLAKKYHII